MNPCFFFCSEGIELSAYSIESRKDMMILACLGSFEKAVLKKMCKTMLVFFFVATSSSDEQSAMRNVTIHGLVNHTDSVG
jgi:hypothetical protein